MTVQEERSDMLGHESEPLINADNVEAASGSPRDEKKSVLQKVKDKAKDKVKKLGSKLKSKGHGGGDDETKKQEMIDDSVPGDELEDEEEVPATETNASDSSQTRNLDVPLDEFALLMKKESNEKRDKQVEEGKRDGLTEGLPSQAIAEQQEPAEAFQAVPTNYHYPNDGKQGDVGDTKIATGIKDEESVNKTDTDDHTQSEQNPPLQLNPSSEGHDQQSRMDGSIFASDRAKGLSDVSNENVQALSSSNLYTGEPDVKSDEKKPDIKPTEREADIPAMDDKKEDGVAGEYSRASASDDQKLEREVEKNTPLDSEERPGTDQSTGEQGEVPAQTPYHSQEEEQQVADQKGGREIEISSRDSSGFKVEDQQTDSEERAIPKAEEREVTGDYASPDQQEQGEIPAQMPYHSKAEEDEVASDQQKTAVDVPSHDEKEVSPRPDDKQEGEVPAQVPYHSKEEEKQAAANQQGAIEHLSETADEQGEIPAHSNAEGKEESSGQQEQLVDSHSEAAEEHRGEVPAQVSYHSQSDEQQADSKLEEEKSSVVDTNEIEEKGDSKISTGSTGGKTESTPADEADNVYSDAKSTPLSTPKEDNRERSPSSGGEVKFEGKPDDSAGIERNVEGKEQIADQDKLSKNNEELNASAPSGLFGQLATKLGYTGK